MTKLRYIRNSITIFLKRRKKAFDNCKLVIFLTLSHYGRVMKKFREEKVPTGNDRI